MKDNNNKVNHTLKEVVFNTVAKARGNETRQAKRFYECLGCLVKINGFDKEMNKLTCSTICGLWLQRRILEAETQEDADKLCQKLGVEEHHLDEYFDLEFNDPLGQFSSSRLRDEYEREEKAKQ